MNTTPQKIGRIITIAIAVVVAMLIIILASIYLSRFVIRPDIAMASQFPENSARRLAELDPFPFGHNIMDATFDIEAGGNTSCSLIVGYIYKMRKTGTPFNPDEFRKYRQWATDNKLFNPPNTAAHKAGNVVNFDMLSKRLPEFFGNTVLPLTYSILPYETNWPERVADALAVGRSVVALTGAKEAGHIFTILEPVRDSAGKVTAFLVSDPNSYEFWTATPRGAWPNLTNELVKLEPTQIAIGVSTVSAYGH